MLDSSPEQQRTRGKYHEKLFHCVYIILRAASVPKELLRVPRLSPVRLLTQFGMILQAAFHQNGETHNLSPGQTQRDDTCCPWLLISKKFICQERPKIRKLRPHEVACVSASRRYVENIFF